MYQDPRLGGQLRHDTCDPDAWGAEMLGFLRDHDADFERWRHEQLQRLDADYQDFRQERFRDDFGRWRSERAARHADLEAQQRSGRVEQREPAIGMPLQSHEMPPGGATITPDADAARHQAQLQAYHGGPAPDDQPDRVRG